ncbi:hypothetical protein PO124_26735 [Bacillus licheniformis]|nr:hypothetical protein [Bacillus licheniformis]
MRITAVLLQPFLTQTPERFRTAWRYGCVTETWDSIQSFGQLKSVTVQKENHCSRVLRRKTKSLISNQNAGNGSKEEPKQEEKHMNGFRNHDRRFMSTELRVAEVIHAEPVKKRIVC